MLERLKEWMGKDWDEVENLDHVHPSIRRLVRPWVFQLLKWALMAAIVFGIASIFLFPGS